MSTQIDPDSLVDPKFIGIPYVLNGRSFKGADCIGLVLLWFEDEGYRIGEVGDGKPIAEGWSDEDPQRYLKALLEYGEYVDFRHVQRNDVVMILNQDPDPEKDARRVDSIAVVIDPGHFLATTKDKGSRVGTFTIPNLRYFIGAIRPRFDEEKKLVRKAKENTPA